MYVISYFIIACWQESRFQDFKIFFNSIPCEYVLVIDQLSNNSDTLAFAVHQPKGQVEMAHPMMKTYEGFFGKVTYDEDFLIETKLSMGKEEDLKGVESFVKMMMGFAMAKPQMKMSPDDMKTKVIDG